MSEAGRLDQYNCGRRGQVFRDLVELKGIVNVPVKNLFLSSDLHFVKGLVNIPDECQQIFTSAWSKLPEDPAFAELWKDKKEAQFTNRVWLTHPQRVRTITFRNDAGRTMFREKDEPQQIITNIERLKRADLVPLHKWNGRLLDAAAFIPDPECNTNFDLFTVRTFARKIYYVNMDTLPSSTGRLPSRRTLRHTLPT